MRYDPALIERFYNAYGDKEWNRFEARVQDRVNLHVHTHYLNEYIRRGKSVLDAGAGPGRFTIQMARVGAKITVLDISEGMLEQNRQRLADAGCDAAVEGRYRGDITNLGQFEDESFDAVVCYGGPLSYVMERADEALEELLRVARPGAPLLLSVMSTAGSTRWALPVIIELSERIGRERVSRVLEDGHLTRDVQGSDHVLKMYRWQELEELLRRHKCKLEVASASSFLTTGRSETCDELVKDDEAWQALLEWELRCCREPGALDGGTHIIAVVRKVA